MKIKEVSLYKDRVYHGWIYQSRETEAWILELKRSSCHYTIVIKKRGRPRKVLADDSSNREDKVIRTLSDSRAAVDLADRLLEKHIYLEPLIMGYRVYTLKAEDD
jgi:hypothetical protein